MGSSGDDRLPSRPPCVGRKRYVVDRLQDTPSFDPSTHEKNTCTIEDEKKCPLMYLNVDY